MANQDTPGQINVHNAGRELYELLDQIVTGDYLWDYRAYPRDPQAASTHKLEQDAEAALSQYKAIFA